MIRPSQLVRCVRHAHGSAAAITSLATDDRGRKLISGAHDGSVCTWALATGCELASRLAPLAPPAPSAPSAAPVAHDRSTDSAQHGAELTALAHVSAASGTVRYVFGGGWSRRLGVWRDDEAHSADAGAAQCVWSSEVAHDEDVLKTALLNQPPSMASLRVISASCAVRRPQFCSTPERTPC